MSLLVCYVAVRNVFESIPRHQMDRSLVFLRADLFDVLVHNKDFESFVALVSHTEEPPNKFVIHPNELVMQTPNIGLAVVVEVFLAILPYMLLEI